ncbi:ABC transporter substrate-binding protein [Planctomycetota bacterium]
MKLWKRIGLHGLLVVAAAAGFGLLLLALGWLVRPDMASKPKNYSKKEKDDAKKLRKIKLNKKEPPCLWRDVDYSQGEAAAWWPKGEAPVLADLVEDEKLEAVAKRVGPEPCVYEGIDGVGTYGGTWHRLANSAGDVGIVSSRFSYANLVRWSPQGYPIVPHVAKSFTVSPDNKTFTFTLRKGMRWSDGEPFTTDDILYWWTYEVNEQGVDDKDRIYAAVPSIMVVAGKPGTVVQVDKHTVQFVFAEPNGLFLAKMATYEGRPMVDCPRHYRRKYHPRIGDQALIEKTMKARKLPHARAVYGTIRDVFNPEHPRLWPWVYRTYKPNPPQVFVRNPFYWMVDTKGNQLPYVDRLLLDVKSPDMIGIAAADGAVTMQSRHIRYDDYTDLMIGRKDGGYEVLHWYGGDRTIFGMQFNLNRKVHAHKPETALKHELLNDKRFRQAMSLAVNRQAIIDAEYNGQAEPAQCAPGPDSFFHEPSAYKAYTEHDPDRANALLDDIGLTRRDYEGMRTFKDGTRMTFFLDVTSYTGEGAAQFMIDDWADVGLRVILRSRSRSYFHTEQWALEHDLDVWGGNGEFIPLLQPRYFVPVQSSFYALAYGKWFLRGGLYGDPQSKGRGCLEPPKDHPLRRAMEVYDAASREAKPERQREIFREALQIAGENVWTMSPSTPPPTLVICKKDFRNVPRTAVYSWDFQSPGNTGIETYYFEAPHDTPGAIRDIKQAILEVTPEPDSVTAAEQKAGKGMLGAVIKWSLLTILLCLIVLVSALHPYIFRRLLIMVPTLFIVSVISFVIIQLPPGDYVTSRIMQLMESGDEADMQQIKDLEEMFHLRDPMHVRYLRWLGVYWFSSFDEKDEGLLQGNMGRSMETSRPVNDIVGDRVMLTVFISLGTILFTWAVAIPVGIYSAVKQYSIGDYVLTFVGFIGMCVPSFLLALLLIYFADQTLGLKVSGLFSPQFGAQPEWNWPKVVDLLQHIWVPIVVLGVGGTAGMIRVMRGNLLDELKKPYVVTARAKGVRPLKLLFKYPVRLALNPFISGIGGLFPMLVSGGAIVAMVLSLPTVGPLMLYSLMSEDMYLAGSMLMVLSLLGMVGTLVSDLLLLWLDPRIRFQGGGR